MLTLTSLTAPLASATAFSSEGPSVLQGPHHGAQKSTITGTVRDASSTSAANVSSELSLMCGLAPSAACGWPWGLAADTGRPVGPINAMELSLNCPTPKMGAGGAKGKGALQRGRENLTCSDRQATSTCRSVTGVCMPKLTAPLRSLSRRAFLGAASALSFAPVLVRAG